MIKKESADNPWSSDDEKEHPSSAMEWWCAESFFSSTDGKKHWSVKAVLSEWCTKAQRIGSNFVLTFFDQETGKNFHLDDRDDTARLTAATDEFRIQFNDSWMKGAFPTYEMHFSNKEKKIELSIKFHAQSYPRWVAQEVTGGWLPMGLGFYRYGFIPKCTLTGTLTIDKKTYLIEGTGYFEHVWGDFTYHRAGAEAGKLKKTLATYTKLLGWWIRHHKIRIPNTLSFSTENNPFGYDWAWAVLDNGWSLFYGNIMFWMTQGPVAGSLILTKDGKTYEELGNVHFNYTKTTAASTFDFHYPAEIELTAQKGKERFQLAFSMDDNIREYAVKFDDKRYWLGLAICEAPGTVKGTYFDGKKTTQLNGICKVEPQRQISMFGHNTIKIDVLKPPKGVGVTSHIHSHFFKKQVLLSIQLAPIPKIKLRWKRIKKKS